MVHANTRISQFVKPAAAVVALVCSGLTMTNAAIAQDAIGGTIVVKNDVRSQKAGKQNFLKLASGARVYQDDLVRTRSNSLTKIVFLDKTNMSVGPDSEAKLDKFVYNGDETAKDVVVQATKGTFRFFSGKSPSRAYRVVTPQAVIGVRGTTYDVRIQGGVSLVVLQDGEVNVCVVNTANCRLLNQPGQSVSVNDNGDITGPLPPADKPWDFASNCTGATSDLCNKTTQFALAPLPPAPAAAPATAAPARAKPRRKVRRTRARPPRSRNIRPRSAPRRRVVRRPRGDYVDEPVYDPPPRRVIIEEPVYIPPSRRPVRCHRGSRRPECRTSRPRPRPCYGTYSRGRCIPRPIVRPIPCRGVYSRGRCITRPIVRPPRHGRPIYRPRPAPGRELRRPTYRPPSYRPPSYGRPSRGRPDFRRPDRGRSGFGRSGSSRPGTGGFRRGGGRSDFRSRGGSSGFRRGGG